MKNFHDVNLPAFLAIHATGEPLFATTIVSTASGRETRMADHASSLQKYTISNCKLSSDQFEEFNIFFRARLGRQYSFRMKDYADHLLRNQIIAEAGHSEAIEVFKSYIDHVRTYNRRVTKLTYGTVELKVNDLDLKGIQIDYNRGLVTLPEPLRPEEKLIINAAFDVEVRFSSDSFTYSAQSDGSIMINDLELMEVNI